MPKTRGARLAVREARLITKELRMLGIPSKTIAKIWVLVVAIPIVLLLGYLMVNYNSGTSDPAILSRVEITAIDGYHSHVKNNSHITLKTLTVRCSPGADMQPTVSTSTLYPPLDSGYGEDVYISGSCEVVAVNQSHQLW